MKLEEYCGVWQTVSERETSDGTRYKICQWRCPNCDKACSSLELAGEWCHGDSLVQSFKEGEHRIMCSSCWLGDGYLQALNKAVNALASACVGTPEPETWEAYQAVCDAVRSEARRRPHLQADERHKPHNVGDHRTAAGGPVG